VQKWVTGVITTLITAFFIGLVSPLDSWVVHKVNPPSADVRIVDVTIGPSPAGFDSPLDMRLENVGDQVADLTRAYVNLRREWVLNPSLSGPLRTGGFEPPSFIYHYEYPLIASRPSSFAPISETIDTGKTDRFTIELDNDLINRRRADSKIRVYEGTVVIQYNGKRVASDNLLLAVTSVGSPDQSRTLGLGKIASIVAANRRAVHEIASTPGNRGPYLQQVLSDLGGK
jgi:hypothetical protein